MILPQKEAKNHKKVLFFSTNLKWGKYRDCFDMMETIFLGQTNEMVQILTKTVLLIKMNHIQLN